MVIQLDGNDQGQDKLVGQSTSSGFARSITPLDVPLVVGDARAC